MFTTFDIDSGALLFSSNDDQKVANIRGHPQVAVLCNGYEGPAASAALLAGKQGVTVSLSGNASLVTHGGHGPNGVSYEDYQERQTARHPMYAGAFLGAHKVVIVVQPK